MQSHYRNHYRVTPYKYGICQNEFIKIFNTYNEAWQYSKKFTGRVDITAIAP